MPLFIVYWNHWYSPDCHMLLKCWDLTSSEGKQMLISIHITARKSFYDTKCIENVSGYPNLKLSQKSKEVCSFHHVDEMRKDSEAKLNPWTPARKLGHESWRRQRAQPMKLLPNIRCTPWPLFYSLSFHKGFTAQLTDRCWFCFSHIIEYKNPLPDINIHSLIIKTQEF